MRLKSGFVCGQVVDRTSENCGEDSFKTYSARSRCQPYLRAEALSKRCSAVFYVHPTGSPHSQIQIQLNPMSRLATLYASDDTFLPERPGRFIV